LTLIELLIDSLTVSPLCAAKKFFEELDINNVCADLYFSIGKITTTALMHSFRVCLRPVFGQDTNYEFD